MSILNIALITLHNVDCYSYDERSLKQKMTTRRSEPLWFSGPVWPGTLREPRRLRAPRPTGPRGSTRPGPGRQRPRAREIHPWRLKWSLKAPESRLFGRICASPGMERGFGVQGFRAFRAFGVQANFAGC